MLKVVVWAKILTLIVLFAEGCGGPQEQAVITERPTAKTIQMTIEFLTRDGCKNTPLMKANLEAAVELSNLPFDIEVVHQATLAADDARTGYPTPTILLDGKDLFGSPVPVQPFPAPS